MIEEPSDFELLQEIEHKKRPRKAEPASRAKNERQYWLDLTAQMLKRPIPQIAKLVQGWPMEWVRDMYLYVNRAEVKNGPALWWWHLKNPKK